VSDKNLITSGYPRSGNTFLNHALNLLFHTKEEVKLNNHTVLVIKKNKKIIVPFRNPVDCIASWHNYPSNGQFIEDIRYYLRFYYAVKENLNKVTLMDFDYFTKDITYIQDKVAADFGITTDKVVTVDEVKKAMLENDKEINLPRNNKDLLNATKEEITKMPELQECIDLYAYLKKVS
jgi:hypothetical protein